MSDAALRALCDRLEQQVVGGKASLDDYGCLAQARAERLRRSKTR